MKVRMRLSRHSLTSCFFQDGDLASSGAFSEVGKKNLKTGEAYNQADMSRFFGVIAELAALAASQTALKPI